MKLKVGEIEANNVLTKISNKTVDGNSVISLGRIKAYGDVILEIGSITELDFDNALKTIKSAGISQEILREFAEILVEAKRAIADNDSKIALSAREKFAKFISGAGAVIKIILQSTAELAVVATYFGLKPSGVPL